MNLRNRWGTRVDPVPWLVVLALSFTVSFAWGPLYFLALGLSLPAGLLLSTVAFLAAAAASYHRFVHTLRPEFRREVPPEARFRRLLEAALIVAVALIGLTLPLALV
ncbi:hypothetical protein [Natronorarus salvus]|uniref:hypothetical protein n=1 Tax=Natronorarus salvus TaxID=3117733 RepID=UPI002F2600F6